MKESTVGKYFEVVAKSSRTYKSDSSYTDLQEAWENSMFDLNDGSICPLRNPKKIFEKAPDTRVHGLGTDDGVVIKIPAGSKKKITLDIERPEKGDFPSLSYEACPGTWVQSSGVKFKFQVSRRNLAIIR